MRPSFRFPVSILDKYFFLETFVPFLIGTVAVALMFDANLLIYIFKTFNTSSVPPAAIIQYVFAKTPGYLTMTLPVGMSLGASLAMSRLVRDSEIVAIRGAGTSILRCLIPFAFFGLLVGAADFYLGEKVIPVSERFASKLEQQMGSLMMTPNFTQNAQFKLDRYQVSIGSLLRSGPEGLSLTDVLLFTRPQPNTIEIIQAKSGTYDHGLWKLKDTTFRLITGDDMVQFRKGEEITINEKIGLSDLFVPPPVEQLSIGQLLQSIELAKKEGRSSREMEIQLNGRFSVPAACLMFGCVAPILAIPFARSGGFAGVLLSVFLVFLYYNSYIICTEIIGRNGWLNPLMSSWLTNILFIFLGVLALRRME